MVTLTPPPLYRCGLASSLRRSGPSYSGLSLFNDSRNLQWSLTFNGTILYNRYLINKSINTFFSIIFSLPVFIGAAEAYFFWVLIDVWVRFCRIFPQQGQNRQDYVQHWVGLFPSLSVLGAILGKGLHGIDYEVGVLPGAHIMFAKSTHRCGVIPPLLSLSRFILRSLPTHGGASLLYMQLCICVACVRQRVSLWRRLLGVCPMVKSQIMHRKSENNAPPPRKKIGFRLWRDAVISIYNPPPKYI